LYFIISVSSLCSEVPSLNRTAGADLMQRRFSYRQNARKSVNRFPEPVHREDEGENLF
jgi:hypothetical protein